MLKIYLYVLDTMADWEVGHAMAELCSQRYFGERKDSSLHTIAPTDRPIRTMGGVTIRPDMSVWQNSEALGPDIVARLRELKQTEGPILLVQGSSDLIQTLLANDLIDEFRLLIFSVVLGKGKRLFGSGTAPAAFKVTKSTTSPNGVLAVTHKREGDIQIGSFALPTPTKPR